MVDVLRAKDKRVDIRVVEESAEIVAQIKTGAVEAIVVVEATTVEDTEARKEKETGTNPVILKRAITLKMAVAQKMPRLQHHKKTYRTEIRWEKKIISSLMVW